MTSNGPVTVSTETIAFSIPYCQYRATLSGDPPASMSGTLSCQVVDVFGTVSGTGLPAGTPPTVSYTLGGVATGTPTNPGVYTATRQISTTVNTTGGDFNPNARTQSAGPGTTAIYTTTLTNRSGSTTRYLLSPAGPRSWKAFGRRSISCA